MMGLLAKISSGLIEAGTQPENLVRSGVLDIAKINDAKSVKKASTKYVKLLENEGFRAREMGVMNNPLTSRQGPLSPRNIITPSDLQGSVLMPHKGDVTATDLSIDSIGGVDMEGAVSSGGFRFPDSARRQTDKEQIGTGLLPYWASTYGPAKAVQNKAEKLELNPATKEKPVVGVYTSMGEEGNFFNDALADTMVQWSNGLPISKKDVARFDAELRKANESWVGLQSPDARNQLLGLEGFPKKGAGALRSKLVKQMSKAAYRDVGFPTKADILQTFTDADLVGAQLGDAGLTMGRIGSEYGLVPIDTHNSYGYGILGDRLGGFERSMPSSILMPDSWGLLGTELTKPKNGGIPELLTDTQKIDALAKRHDLFQIADQKWVDQASTWLEQNKNGTLKGALTAIGLPLAFQSEDADAGTLGLLSRMARAKDQGFDMSPEGRLYHASKQDIDEMKAGYNDGLVFTTPDPEFANQWLGKGKFQERQIGGSIEGIKKEKEQWKLEADKKLQSLPESERTQYFEDVLLPQQQKLLIDERNADSAIYPLVSRTKKPFRPDQDFEVLEEFYGKEYLDAPFGSGFATFRDAMKDGNYLLYENKEMVDFLKSKGYDSMFLKETAGKDSPFSTMAVFDGGDLRSPNAQFKDPTSSNIMASAAGAGLLGAFQSEDADAGFFSQAVRAAENLSRKSGNAQGFFNDLTGKGQVKPDELNAMGFQEHFGNRSDISREEVQSFISDNQLQLQETRLGRNDEYGLFDADDGQIEEMYATREEAEAALALVDQDEFYLANYGSGQDTSKFGDWTLDGGDNYRELLLQTNNSKGLLDEIDALDAQRQDFREGYRNSISPRDGSEADNAVRRRFDAAPNDIDLDAFIASDSPYYASLLSNRDALYEQKHSLGEAFINEDHFDEENILAHLRMKDRVDAEGNKTLLVEEVQSDWHQTGAQEGYQTPNKRKELQDEYEPQL